MSWGDVIIQTRLVFGNSGTLTGFGGRRIFATNAGDQREMRGGGRGGRGRRWWRGGGKNASLISRYYNKSFISRQQKSHFGPKGGVINPTRKRRNTKRVNPFLPTVLRDSQGKGKMRFGLQKNTTYQKRFYKTVSPLKTGQRRYDSG